MAAPLRAIGGRLITFSLKTAIYNLESIPTKQSSLILLSQPVRYDTNFFNRVKADQLWKGVTSVSNAGAKKGRGRGTGKKRATDLNRGQELGDGKLNFMWPGLNAPILKGREIVERHQAPPNPEKQAKILKLRSGQLQFRRPSIAPLLRGWSGTKLPGQRIGPPDPTATCNFEGFNSIVLEFKIVTHATRRFTRNKMFSALIVTGNGNGMAGLSLTKSVLGKAAVNKGRNKCGKRLEYFERFDDRTVFHSTFVQVDRTKLIIRKKAAGYGLRCHRIIKAICEMVGIKDLCVKVEGAVNPQKIAKGFFQALRKQENHQKLANRTGLYVVEISPNRDKYPRILATPETPIRKEMDKDEPFDLNVIYSEGRLEKYKPPRPPFFANFPRHLKISEQKLMHRNKVAFMVAHRAHNQ